MNTPKGLKWLGMGECVGWGGRLFGVSREAENPRGPRGRSEINRSVLIPAWGPLNRGPGCVAVDVGRGVPSAGCFWDAPVPAFNGLLCCVSACAAADGPCVAPMPARLLPLPFLKQTAEATGGLGAGLATERTGPGDIPPGHPRENSRAAQQGPSNKAGTSWSLSSLP